MRVRVIDRGKGSVYQVVTIRTVEIADTCPECGGPRGTPAACSFFEDGESLGCDTWNNPCGHEDYYPDCIVEAEASAKAALVPPM